MKKYLYLFLISLLGLGMGFILISGAGNQKNTDSDSEAPVTLGLPKEVLQYEKIVKQEAKNEKIPDKTQTLLAIMAVETGGRGNDVMQSSESLGLPPNSLQPIDSIKQGVKYYASLLRSARDKGCDDDVAIGSYNFGGGYIDFVVKNGKKHTLVVAEKFSHDVVAPSLGNTTGQKYYYGNPIADSHGNYLYLNGGNFYYVDLVKQYLGSSGSSIAILDSVLGQRVLNGQCYGMTAYYVEKLGGPQMMGSGFMNAGDIGTDYDWNSYGWTVILKPKFEDLKAGDVINWVQGDVATSIFGHTGVIKSVNKSKKTIQSYEQNGEKGEIVAVYERSWSQYISSIVRKQAK
ncbi:lysozyme family protein [Enterococcus sp. DIV1758]|uniref:lysozyme family protein n=1 Tax=Enterococcus sp. DIV1758 TaxID=2774744 RepID=UPI003F1FB717